MEECSITAKRFSARTREARSGNRLKHCYDVQLIFGMAEGRRSQVLLLDDRRLDILIQPKLYAGDLLAMVSSHFNLKEKEYFGLAYQDEMGHFYWLQLDRRVLEHDFPKKQNQGSAPLLLYFLVKYFVEHISQLRDSTTVEAFYLQAKSLIAKGTIEVESESAFHLAALVLQATHGDFTDEVTAKSNLKRLPVLPTSVFKEHPSLTLCEERVLHYYKDLNGQSRGSCIVKYMTLVETLPTYGIHYYQVKDKGGIPWWLGLNHRGLGQYDFSDRKVPRKVFLWKQLENLYYRDRKFSIEVNDARRVVHTLSSFNLYEDAIEEPPSNTDELSDAICDPTTQVSVTRRTFGPGNVTVYVWLALTPCLTKCIWSMTIAQHQFYLDRKHNKPQTLVGRNLGDIAAELSRSSQSLSSSTSTPNLSRSASTHSLPTSLIIDGNSDKAREARQAMLAALRAKRDALQDILNEREAELKLINAKEQELTGDIPTTVVDGENLPQGRRRIGTSFTVNDKLIATGLPAEEQVLSKLELDFEIQSQIVSAALKLVNDMTAKKNVRRQRKVTYQQAQVKLKEIEKELLQKRKQAELRKRKAALKASDDEPSEDNISHSTDGSGISQDRAGSDSLSNLQSGIDDTNNQINRVLTVSTTSQHHSSNCSSPVPSSASSSLQETHLSRQGSISAPPSPTKLRHTPLNSVNTPPTSPVPRSVRGSRKYLDGQGYKPSSIYQTRQSYRTQHYPTLPLNGSTGAHRKYSTESEYDNVSIESGILKTPYQNRFEASLNTEGSNLYSVSTQRTSQALDTKDDIILPSPTPRNEQELGLMSRHNSLDSMRRHSIQRSHLIGQSATQKSANFKTPPQSPSFKNPPQSPSYKSSAMPQSPNLNKPQPFPTSNSYDERLLRLSSKQPLRLEDKSHCRLRRQQSYTQQQQMLFQWQQQMNQNDMYRQSFQRQFRTQLDARGTEFLDNGESDFPVFDEHPGSPNRKKDGRDCVDSVSFLPPHPNRTRLPHEEMRESTRSRLNPQHQNTTRPSTLPLLPKHQHMQRHSSVGGGLCNSGNLIQKPVSVVHPQQWLETSLDDFSPIQSPKMKGKEWTETSLDSPLPSRRQKAKDNAFCSTVTNNCNLTAASVSNCTLVPATALNELSELCANNLRAASPMVLNQSLLHPGSLQTSLHNRSLEMKESPLHSPNSSTNGRTSVIPEFLNSSGVEVDVVSVGHFQPYWEETKPYELSDFYKYSTKHRASSQDSSSSLHGASVPEKNTSQTSQWESLVHSPSPRQLSHHNLVKVAGMLPNCGLTNPNQMKSPVMSPDSSFTFEGARGSVADAFHEEMLAWYEDQDNVKRATLV